MATANSALTIWRGDEYILGFLFAIQLQLQPTNIAEQHPPLTYRSVRAGNKQ